MSLLLSAVICTHNPRPEFFRRTIDALKAQTLPRDQWELVVVDNASQPEVGSRFPLHWHPEARHVLEPRLGVASARLCGIAEARGSLIVFVDDDNILAPDYLEQALAIGKEFPFLGVWGGSLEPEFEAPPPSWTLPHLGKLAVRPVTRDRWSNAHDDWPSTPVGAGMCVRASIAREHVRKMAGSELARLLSRGEDSSIVLTALEMNFGQGVFARLKATHIIPSSRLQEGYLLKITEATSSYGVLVEHLHRLPQNPLQPARRFAVSCLGTFLRRGPRAARFRIAARRGRLTMLRRMASL